MKIKIVANKPRGGQIGVPRLIGRTYNAFGWDKVAGEVSINSPSFGGTIVLNRGEWKQVSVKRASGKGNGQGLTD